MSFAASPVVAFTFPGLLGRRQFGLGDLDQGFSVDLGTVSKTGLPFPFEFVEGAKERFRKLNLLSEMATEFLGDQPLGIPDPGVDGDAGPFALISKGPAAEEVMTSSGRGFVRAIHSSRCSPGL